MKVIKVMIKQKKNFYNKMRKKILFYKVTLKHPKLKEQQGQLGLDNIPKINQIVNNHHNMFIKVLYKRNIQKNKKNRELNKSFVSKLMKDAIFT